ncbi:glycoside hydrolase family 31 protein [Cohnella lupini]|uniref:Glycosyl hydrolase family 31 n=1 Tax=Cohnella lupini TaxID=1294267 RepID=A0A3D9INK6_9BACL|nr:glycoside hydrolase family 31 protein [Cohnella lupini]RED63287.1 glycosyl hydrolase family 31 [Cohnella lupini]
MAEKITEFALLKDEFWWGGAIHDGIRMPYGTIDVEHDLSNLLENSGAPFLISNRGRYIWQNRPFRFEFRSGKLSIGCEEEVNLHEGHVTLSEAFHEAAGKYFPAIGRMPDPLAITAPQYCTWMEMHYEPTQQKTLDYAREIIRQGFPPGVLIIDDNWMEDYGTWKFNPSRFPDPKSMVDKLHDLGFKVMLWVCPYVSPDSRTGRSLGKQGFLVQDEKGKTALRRWWNGCSAVLDYTHPEAWTWFKETLDGLVEQYGIDGFKFDAGDPAGDPNSEWATGFQWKGTDIPNEDCAAYSRLGLHYPLSEYRASWKMGGAPLMQRLRDKPHSWGKDGIRMLIPNSIAQGLVGFAFNCPDMVGGGWDGDLGGNAFDPELFVRYAQCAALFPMMQFSTAPWKALDERMASYCLEAVKLRESLGAELLSLADEAGRKGTPILRAMEFVFPGRGFESIKDQFMVGDEILVAPVLVKGAASRQIIFPEGEWVGDDGSRVVGPVNLRVEAPLSRLPWYRREIRSV